jgi:hypothetical protein
MTFVTIFIHDMAKTILIPIDFKVASLLTLRHALEKYENENIKVDVVLLYAQFLSDSITELLFYSPHKYIKPDENAEFTHALEILKNRYSSRLGHVSFELLHFNTKSYLERFLNVRNISCIYVPQKYSLHLNANGFDSVPLLKKAMVPLHELAFDMPNSPNSNQHLTALFN